MDQHSQVAIPDREVFTKAALKAIGIPHSNPQLCRMEKRNEFPKRFYLSSKCPVWNAGEIYAWLVARQAGREPNHVTAKATATRTRGCQAKRLLADSGDES
jgi:prophage regulatory protein